MATLHAKNRERNFYEHELRDKQTIDLVRISGNIISIGEVISESYAGNDGTKGYTKQTRFSAGSRRRMQNFIIESDARYEYFYTLTAPGWEHDLNGEWWWWMWDGTRFKAAMKKFFQFFRRRVLGSIRCEKTGNTLETECEKKRMTYRQAYKLAGYQITWFLEFQKRGAPHVHFFSTHAVNRNALSLTWHECMFGSLAGYRRPSYKGQNFHKTYGVHVKKWNKHKDDTEEVSRRKQANYAAKYAAKQEQKDVPQGYQLCGGFWSHIGETGNATRGKLSKPEGYNLSTRTLLLLAHTKKIMQAFAAYNATEAATTVNYVYQPVPTTNKILHVRRYHRESIQYHAPDGYRQYLKQISAYLNLIEEKVKEEKSTPDYTYDGVLEDVVAELDVYTNFISNHQRKTQHII